MTTLPLPALHDAEGNTVPVDFPPVVDAHVHVQCFDMNGEEMEDLYDLCQREGKPIVIHAGREPKSQKYPCDPYEICRAEKLELVLQSFPMVRICVPHLGVDEFSAYKDLIEQYDNLWLDTAMALTDYLPFDNPVRLGEMRADRVMYGSDFPNIPYAWDRELIWLAKANLDRQALERIITKNALHFFDLKEPDL